MYANTMDLQRIALENQLRQQQQEEEGKEGEATTPTTPSSLQSSQVWDEGNTGPAGEGRIAVAQQGGKSYLLLFFKYQWSGLCCLFLSVRSCACVCVHMRVPISVCVCVSLCARECTFLSLPRLYLSPSFFKARNPLKHFC